MTNVVRGAFWFGIYLFLIAFPLAVAVLGRHPGEGRGFWVEFAVACGYVGFAIMASEFALVSRTQSVAGIFGQDALQHFHKQMGYAGTGFVLAHPMLLFMQGLPWGMLNPLSQEHRWEWRSGAIGFWALMLLIFVAAFRKRLRISYEWWHLTHALIACVAVLGALVHAYLVGHDSARPAMRALWLCYLLVLFGLAVQYRILRPLNIWRKPWEVMENIKEHGNSRTLMLRPINHDGFTFAPGQFAWLNTGKTPFHFDQHPISISSSSEQGSNGEIAFTIKALGDWSGEVVPILKPGTRIWLDGPYGVFSVDRDQGPGFVMIGGGVGITPLHSMCKTLAARGDNRPVVVFDCAPEFEELIFREEFEELQTRMTLKLVYVLEHPSEDWHGESGYITSDLLLRYLPRRYERYQFFICGPAPLMDSVEQSLQEIGVVSELVHSERFNVV
jgi:predicted ferric reductase